MAGVKTTVMVSLSYPHGTCPATGCQDTGKDAPIPEAVVSIIIPSRRVDAMVLSCVGKIRELYRVVRIVVVVDPGCAEKDGRLSGEILLLESVNRNISSKRNAGVAAVATEYVAFIDSDAYPAPGWLENGVAFLEMHEAYAMATGRQYSPPADGFFQRCIRKMRKSRLFSSGELRRIHGDAPAESDCGFAQTANMIVRRRDYLRVGGMREDIYIFEDKEFCDRYRAAGGIIRFIPDCAVFHRERPLSAFLRQRYSYAYSVPIYYRAVGGAGFLLVHALPLLGVLVFIALLLVFGLLGYGIGSLFAIPGAVFLAFAVESARLASGVREGAAIFGSAILMYAFWIVGTIWGLLGLPPRPYVMYKH
jgi:glycosyltransferase involved in cell wall biosynthesis